MDFSPFCLRQAGAAPPGLLPWLAVVLNPDTHGQPQTPDIDWNGAIPYLTTHGLAPLAYVRLRDQGAEGVPANVFAAFQQAYHANALRTYYLELELERVLGLLQVHGVQVLPIKGAALAKTCYGGAAERPISDIDLLIHREDVSQTQAVLTRHGYQTSGSTWLGPQQRRYRAEVQLRGIGQENNGVLLELHWSLVEIPYYIESIPSEAIWQHTVTLGEVELPDHITLMLHCCAHAAFHHAYDLRLIWLVDVDRLLRMPDLTWSELPERAQAWGLGYALATTVAVTKGWLNTPIPSRVHDALNSLSHDGLGRAMFGVADEQNTPAGRKAWLSWQAFGWRQRLSYAAWLGLRSLSRPLEAYERHRFNTQTD